MNGQVITDKILRNGNSVWATNRKEMAGNLLSEKKTAGEVALTD
jgi:hypothetical protein